MGFDEMMKQVAVTLERDGSVRAVFGEAIKLEHHTIVPVAVVSGGGGGGGAQGTAAASFAGGAGLAVNVRPVGFISERNDGVHFTPIHLEEPQRSVLTEAAAGMRRAIEQISGVIAQYARSRTKAPSTPAPRASRPASPRAVAGETPTLPTSADEPAPVMSPS